MNAEKQYLELYQHSSRMIKKNSAEALNAVRDAAFEDFRRLGFPSRKVESFGSSMTNFMRAAINAKREYQGLEPLNTSEFMKLMREKRELVELDSKLARRSVNEGFSGGEKKRNEIFQMAMLEPKLSILDETDSGLDVDAMRIVADGVNKMHTDKTSAIVITHYERLLDMIKPSVVHVLYKGRIVKTAGPELAKEIETRGYDWIKAEVDGKE